MSHFPDRFAGRRAVITGGASGIGLAVGRRILAEGGQVTVWDRGEAEGLPTSRLDVSDPAAVRAAADAAVEAMGGIDVLVCSAGITGPNATTWTYGDEDWARVIDINVNGMFHSLKAVVPVMLPQRYGRIVTIASVAGKEGNANAPAYSTSKAAVIGLTKSLGKELATTGITANCVTPAAVRTAIFDQMSQAHIDFMLSKIPMGRFGEIAEIVALVTWLASEECSFSTGAVFDASGGRATY